MAGPAQASSDSKAKAFKIMTSLKPCKGYLHSTIIYRAPMLEQLLDRRVNLSPTTCMRPLVTEVDKPTFSIDDFAV